MRTYSGKQIIVLCISILLFITVSYAADKSMNLKKNPFQRPDLFSTGINQAPVVTPDGPGAELDIRAAMSAGENSLVNIAGNIVRIGEEIQGYRLLSVEEGKVIFSKNNSLVTVIIKRERLAN